MHPPNPPTGVDDDPPRHVLVLGAGGFIGSHLSAALLARDVSVVAVDRRDDKLAALRGDARLRFLEGDAGDPGLIEDLVRECDVVVHLAAICNPSVYNTRPLEVIESNFLHALPVIRACTEMRRRLVYFSTCEVYGRTLAGFLPPGTATDPDLFVLREETTPLVLGPVSRQRWCYAAAKQLTERVLHAEATTRGLRCTVVRPFNFIGPRMDYLPGVDGDGVPRVVACFMDAFLRGRPPLLVDGGRARRSFLDIEDAVDAVLRILRRPSAADGRTFNIGHPGNEVTIADLARRMAAEFERCTGRRTIPARAVPAAEFYGDGYEDCDRRVPDITLARTLLGWEPRHGLDAALRRTVEAFVAGYGDLVRPE